VLYEWSIIRGPTPEEPEMLAEIFMLRLEARLRAAKEAAQAERPNFVPLPTRVLPNFRKSELAETKTA
jgi:hypothetical protein